MTIIEITMYCVQELDNNNFSVFPNIYYLNKFFILFQSLKPVHPIKILFIPKWPFDMGCVHTVTSFW